MRLCHAKVLPLQQKSGSRLHWSLQSASKEKKGKVLEWLKRHAWKACIRQKRIGGSNPPLSAKVYRPASNEARWSVDFFRYIAYALRLFPSAFAYVLGKNCHGFAYVLGKFPPDFAYVLGNNHHGFAYVLGNNHYLCKVKQCCNYHDIQAIN